MSLLRHRYHQHVPYIHGHPTTHFARHAPHKTLSGQMRVPDQPGMLSRSSCDLIQHPRTTMPVRRCSDAACCVLLTCWALAHACELGIQTRLRESHVSSIHALRHPSHGATSIILADVRREYCWSLFWSDASKPYRKMLRMQLKNTYVHAKNKGTDHRHCLAWFLPPD